MEKVKVAVEFDPTPIRHMAIQCPKCERWFNMYDVATTNIDYKHDIDSLAKCECPACQHEFDLGNVEFEYPEFPDFYDKKCAKKKVVWK